MFFVKKFLFFILLLASLGNSGSDLRSQFLHDYYNGDFDSAHKLLSKAYTDPPAVQVWENRIHYYKDFPDCSVYESAPPSSRAMAHLLIGDIPRAKAEFGEDRLSLLALAILKSWQGDVVGAREAVKSALVLAPGDSDALFLAGNLAPTDDEAIEWLTRYLEHPGDDSLKAASAADAVDFLKKTTGMKLNVAFLDHPPGNFETQYDEGHLFIRGTVNGKQKVKLLVDTGASGLSLPDREWEPKITSQLRMVGLGKKAVSSGKILVLDQFHAGPFSLLNPVVAVSPSFQADGFDGIAGSILFSDYTILAPLKSGQNFRLFPQTQDPPADLEKNGLHFKERVTLPFYQVNKMIILKGQINRSGDQMDFLLDTGAQQSVLSTSAARRLAHINYHSTLYTQQQTNLKGLGGVVESQLVAEGVDVRLGPLSKEFKKIPSINLADISEALELELDMILGQDFLSGYTLLIDYNNNKVTFLR
jgi:hypothetical protein